MDCTHAGAFFSFTMMWLGILLLSKQNGQKKAIGFSLIFANLPLGRIAEVMKGAGDEMVVARHFLKDNFRINQVTLITSIIILILGLPPIIKAYRILKNKYAGIYIIGFLTLPVAFILIYILIGMNTVLKNGFMATIGIMGTALLITIHTAIALILLIILSKKLYLLNIKN